MFVVIKKTVLIGQYRNTLGTIPLMKFTRMCSLYRNHRTKFFKCIDTGTINVTLESMTIPNHCKRHIRLLFIAAVTMQLWFITDKLNDI